MFNMSQLIKTGHCPKEKKMSCLENNILKEKLADCFEIAMVDDYELQNELASLFLEGLDHYLYCKENARDLLHSYEDEIYEKIEECFFNHDEACFDIRHLAEEAFSIKFKEKIDGTS